MNKVSKKYMVATIIDEIQNLKQVVDVLLDMERDMKVKIEIIGHNQNEFKKVENLLTNMDYLMKKDEYIQNMSFWNRLRFLIVGKI